MVKKVIISVVVVLLLLTVYLSKPQILFPNYVKGHFLDAEYYTGSDGDTHLWILTDGSFRTRYEKKTGNSHELGIKGFFCKLHLYKFNPETKTILSRTTLELDTLPRYYSLTLNEKGLWALNDRIPYKLFCFDPQNGGLLFDVTGFAAEHPELQSGIAQWTYFDTRGELQIKTNDGLECVYRFSDNSIQKERFRFPSHRHVDPQSSFDTISVFALYEEDGARSRRHLSILTGPRQSLSYLQHSSMLKSEKEIARVNDRYLPALRIDVDQLFLEGEIAYRNEQYIIIVHQNSLGTDAKRLISCVTITGEKVFTLSQNELFKGMRLHPQNSFSDWMFIKNKMTFSIHENTAVLVWRGDKPGALGINLSSGKTVWRNTF